MTRLDAHLAQITISASMLNHLVFPAPGIFTNAILEPHHITALIRDTEAHERALFSVPNATHASVKSTLGDAARTSRIDTNMGGGPRVARAHRSQTAVAAVLGGDMMERIRRVDRAGPRDDTGYTDDTNRARGELDVELLLKGAEKLCGVYPIPGALSKISSLRVRYPQLRSSLQRQEALIAQLSSSRDRQRLDELEDADVDATPRRPDSAAENVEVSEDDIKREEEEIRFLQRRKQELEERISGMERDLGGLRG